MEIYQMIAIVLASFHVLMTCNKMLRESRVINDSNLNDNTYRLSFPFWIERGTGTDYESTALNETQLRNRRILFAAMRCLISPLNTIPIG